MKKMENIILYGAGKNIYNIIDILRKTGGFEVKEIWDSNPQKVGNTFLINHKEVSVCLPENKLCDIPILITSNKYEKEIRELLINSFGIKNQNIKNWRYCFHNIKDKILVKYKEIENKEIQSILEYLRDNDLDVFLDNDLRNIDVDRSEFVIEKDAKTGLLYSWWKDRKIFLKRSICQEYSAKSYLCTIQNEQKLNSPHCYCQNGFEITEKDVIVDGGAAEGFFALENVERTKKIFLIEGDKQWLEALQETFRPYSDKVVIVPKWLGNVVDDHTVTIDYLNKEKEITFIKLDIEGAEVEALEGAKETLQSSKNLKVMACTYHNSIEADILARQFLNAGFKAHFSKGYMFYPYGKTIEPGLWHGLLLAEKQERCKVLIWGAGKNAELVYKAIDGQACELIGLVDANIEKANKLWKEKYLIYMPDDILELSYDYIIISLKSYSEEILENCLKLGVDENVVIDFWDIKNSDLHFIDWNIPLIEKLKKEIDTYKLRLENIPYELGMGDAPKIYPTEKLLEKILKERKSLCRFGDGELEIMRGNERPWFQNPDKKLARRLKEVLCSDEENILTAVADNFGNLDKYTDDAADGIRQYLSGDTRNAVIDLLDLEKTYYDAYVSRPYLIYKDKSRAVGIFSLFKEIWMERNILVVEGEYSRLGVGNDLFSTAKEIRRILCPAQNAFSQYETILKYVLKEADKNDLVIISLGPAATVLAYDIARNGIQALDIGQLDNEYEWYLMGAKKRERIPEKAVAEMAWCHEMEKVDDKQYYEQIVKRIYLNL